MKFLLCTHTHITSHHRYGMDLNGARRKNATRETTSMLKAWLSEHRKNPYPTKGEKIMLAIVTKMTLTQVRDINLSLFLLFLMHELLTLLLLWMMVAFEI